MKNNSHSPCYHSHPALPIGDKVIYGGNCGTPKHLDCDVYIALQSGSSVQLPHPWEEGFGTIVQVRYPIQDMGVPGNPAEFKKMINWLCNQLQEGKKIHVGCIGGHGRTGMLFAALVAVAMPEVKNAIEYVRKNYCDHAVESRGQVQFLMKHFGVAEAIEYKKATAYGSVDWGGTNTGRVPKHSAPSKGASEFSAPKSARFADAKRSIDPVPSARNIFTAVGK